MRTKAASAWDMLINLMLLTIVQCLMLLGFLLRGERSEFVSILQGFGGIVLCQWLLFVFYAMIRRKSFEMETMAFFLSTIGLSVVASSAPGSVWMRRNQS